MVIINAGCSFNAVEDDLVETQRSSLQSSLNTLPCNNNCSRDTLIYLHYNKVKKTVQARLDGACCPEYKEIICKILKGSFHKDFIK